MQWRTKRKLTYTTIALSPLFVIAGIIYTATFFPNPTCSDGIQNQGEEGVDCGGVCERLCQAAVPSLDTVWDRAFSVSDSVYNLAAYIENPNRDLVARDVPYRFRVYDRDNILISERYGQMDILPQPAMIAFAAGVDTNGREVSRVDFSFTQVPFWEESTINEVRFDTNNRDFDASGSTPRLSVDVTNVNSRPLRDIRLAALVLDSNGQAVHVSQTLVGELDVQETDSVVFTWREPFPNKSNFYQTQIIPTAYELAN